MAHTHDLGNSDETHDDSDATLRKFAQQLIDLALGADVDAARRLINRPMASLTRS